MPRAQPEDEDSRQFTPDEAEKILARAASMSLARPDPDERMSLAELVGAAELAGIDGALVRRAAAELEVDIVEAPRRLGMTTRVVRRRWLPRRLARAELERLGARLDAFFGAHGRRELHEHAASWTARHIQVSIESRDGGSMIQISERFVNTIANRGGLAAMFGAMTAALLALGIESALGLTPWLSFVPLALVMAWLALAAMRRSHEAKLERITAEFERALDSLEQASLAELTGPTTDPNY